MDTVPDFVLKQDSALASVLGLFGVHLLKFTLLYIHPSALMHFLGLLEFPVRICDANAHHNTHKTYLHVIYPVIAISENTPGLLITFGTLCCVHVGLLKQRVIGPSLTAFIGSFFACVYVCSQNAFLNITKYMSSMGITMNFDIL